MRTKALINDFRQRRDVFDALPEQSKLRLAELMRVFEYDTCVALSAAAGDYRFTHENGNGHAHQTCTPAEVL